MALSAEDKERFLKALEEDREFRYAVMGLLGIRELIERMDRLEERMMKLEERMLEVEQRLEEHAKAIKALQEQVARVWERLEKLEERQAKLEEAVVRLVEAVDKLQASIAELKKAVGALGRRFGRRFEALIREAYDDMFRSIGVEPVKVQRFRYVDVDGRYLAPGASIEIDVYIHDSVMWLIEVKSFVEADDVTWFKTKCDIAERILSRRAQRRILLAIEAEREAVDAAKKLGVELIAGEVVED